MPDVVKHAWTHRSKAKGGTDPLPISLPFCFGYYDSSQSITTGTELRLDTFVTNDRDIFKLDNTSTPNPRGILIKKEGFYQIFGEVIGSGTKAFYIQTQPASSYPTLGNEDEPGSFPLSAPFNFNQENIDNTDTPLNTFAFRRMFGTPAAPYRTILGAAGTWTATLSSLVIVRIGDL